jgi:hypothetical protein
MLDQSVGNRRRGVTSVANPDAADTADAADAAHSPYAPDASDPTDATHSTNAAFRSRTAHDDLPLVQQPPALRRHARLLQHIEP